MSETLIEITSKALEEIKKIFTKETPKENFGLRLMVVGGGCSGFSYKMEFSEQKAKDNLIEQDGVKILIDPKSLIYLKGISLDFQDGLSGKGFVFNNPNAKNTCGCGESFNI